MRGTPVVQDPLTAKYDVNRKALLGSGADGGVVRGVVRKTEELHALKFLSSEAYSPQREIEILQKLEHPNVVPVYQVFPPIGTRRHWVLAMPEADFTLHEYLARSKGPAATRGAGRVTEAVARDLAQQLLSGIECLHRLWVVHRDIKPANILVSLCHDPATRGQSGLHLWLADFSRARHVPPRKRIGHKRPRQPSRWAMTQNVCTYAYCAPEAMVSDGADAESAKYGLPVDIWSFGAVLFEMIVMQRFAPGLCAAECVGAVRSRLGGSTSVPSVAMVPPRTELLPLSSYLDRLTGWRADVLHAALQWEPDDRLSAGGLSTLVSGGGEATQARPANAAAAVAKPPAATRGADHPMLSPYVTRQKTARSKTTCACAGHCYTPGHRYRRGCNSKDLLEGSRYCPLCSCCIPGRGRPRLRGSYCSLHKRVLESCCPELRLAHAARGVAVDLIPCDVTDFVRMFQRHRNDLGSLVLFSMLKEPSATGAWEATGVPGTLATSCTTGALAVSLLAVVRKAHELPDMSVMRQLNKQGAVGRGQGHTDLCN